MSELTATTNVMLARCPACRGLWIVDKIERILGLVRCPACRHADRMVALTRAFLASKPKPGERRWPRPQRREVA